MSDLLFFCFRAFLMVFVTFVLLVRMMSLVMMMFGLSDFGGRGSNTFMEASTRPLASILITLTSTSSPICTTSSTLLVRVQASSEM